MTTEVETDAAERQKAWKRQVYSIHLSPQLRGRVELYREKMGMSSTAEATRSLVIRALEAFEDKGGAK